MLASLANDRLEEIMKNPTQFAGVVALSMHDRQAAAELKRCMTEKKGIVGVMLNDFQSGGRDGNTVLFYDQPQYDVFWKLRKSCNTFDTRADVERYAFAGVLSARLCQSHPYACVGHHHCWVLDRFPGVKLIFGHM